jgi:Lon protease-like protein
VPASPPHPSNSPEPLLLQQLPLFPLQTVLFPGGWLPLRIFEVRYLDMIKRCHQAGAPFGVVWLTEGSEVRRPDPGAPAGGDGFAPEVFHPVGTLARIDSLERPQPGLMMVRCEGLQRFEVTARRQLRHGLWVGDVRLFSADPVVPVIDHLQPVRDALKRLLESLQERDPDSLPNLPLQPPYQWDDSGWVANRWLELLPVPNDIKLRLMALDNPMVRLELVADLLEKLNLNI